MSERHASCSCGQLNVTVTGEPVRISMCHCLACQKRSGSVFAVQARFPEENVKIRGDAHQWMRIGDSGSRATHRFCPVCGSTVFYTMDTMPGVIAVAVGAFADPTFPPPKISVYEARRHPWAVMPSLEADHFD
jgi:hypothetical protein